ncbi:hypothetical protein ABPG75_010092 [Micractinium tetrahymenae]
MVRELRAFSFCLLLVGLAERSLALSRHGGILDHQQDRRLLGATASDLAHPGYATVFRRLKASEADVLQLINTLAGTAVLLGQPQYGRARNLTQNINMMYNTAQPLLIVYAASEGDVAAAVRFAAQRRLPLCPRAGGHDSAGACICEGGIVVDVSGMTQINLFPERGEAQLEAGVRFRDLTAALAPHDLAALQGDCADVGITGYTLGGGWGKLTKSHGLGVDNVLAYRVVLADGSTVVANETGPYSDLFWIFRQAEVLTWNATWDAAASPRRAARVLKAWQDHFLNKEPRQLSLYPHFQADRTARTQLLVMYAIYTEVGPGAEAELRRLLHPLRALRPLDTATARIPTANLSDLMDALEDPIMGSAPPGGAMASPEMWELKLGMFVERRLSLKEMRAIVDGWLTWPAFPANYSGPAWTYAYFEPVEGAAADVAPDAMAYVHREVGWDLVVDTFFLSSPPGMLRRAQRWLGGLHGKRWAPLLSGRAYQNYPSFSRLYSPRGRALQRYYGSNLCRLVQLKAKYDPAEVFSSAQGVPPRLSGCA